MFLPQLTSGASSVDFSPDGQSLVYSMAGSLWLQRIGEDRAQGLCALLCFGCSLETLRIGAAEAGDAVNVLGTESEEGPQAACQRSASMIMSGGW